MEIMKRLFALTLLLILFVSCAPTATGTQLPAASPTVLPASSSPTAIPHTWWRDAVFYEIFVRSFYDTNADGIGDFNGVTQKLDYLQSLGVNAIWLMPIQPSPSYHGYDVTDYYTVNPQYGTMNDFKRLLSEARSRDMRVIIDLVLNHTSSQHPWFIEANSNPQSKYRNWYVWSDTDPGDGWHPGIGGYYFGLFCDCMPDLNYRNPEVTAEMEKMARFWLNDIGIDGFRVDAAKHLIEESGKIENTAATHEWLKGFYDAYKADKPNAYAVGEVYGAGGLIAKTYTGQLDEVFNFELASGFVNSANGGSNSGVTSAIKLTLKDMPGGQYATFLTNHDQNRGMSLFNGKVDKAKVAASLLLTAPGTPFIYYGEEIGMEGQKPDEDIRLPMQWSADTATAGFTSSAPWRAPGTKTVSTNVAIEDKDPNSLLNHYRALIALRKGHPALQTGALTLLETGNSAVYAILRYEADETVMVVINLGSQPVRAYSLYLAGSRLIDGPYSMNIIFGTGNVPPLKISNGKFDAYQPRPELAPFETLVISMSR
jgi:alpha-amylase